MPAQEIAADGDEFFEPAEHGAQGDEFAEGDEFAFGVEVFGDTGGGIDGEHAVEPVFLSGIGGHGLARDGTEHERRAGAGDKVFDPGAHVGVA